MKEPELTLVELVGGPFDGTEVLVEPKGSPTVLALSWHGERVPYRLGTDGVWRFDPGHGGAFPGVTDKLVDAAVNVAGMDTLCQMMALTAVKQAMAGNFHFWSAMVARIDRRLAGGEQGEEWKE